MRGRASRASNTEHGSAPDSARHHFELNQLFNTGTRNSARRVHSPPRWARICSMFRRGVGTMVLTERMQALGDHARSSNQRLIAERREEREQNSRDDESHGQENRGQLIFDQEIRDQESRAANARGETIMLETALSMPSPPEVSPAEDVIIIESIATFSPSMSRRRSVSRKAPAPARLRLTLQQAPTHPDKPSPAKTAKTMMASPPGAP